MIKRTPLKRSKKRIRKVTKRPMGVLKRKLDSAFAKMIRERDRDLLCISCQKNKGTQCGHFIRREVLATRWHPLNCASQCSYCNCWLHGNLLEYQDGLERKHGAGTVQTLRRLANVSWKPTREALEALLATAQIDAEAYQETWNFYGAK